MSREESFHAHSLSAPANQMIQTLFHDAWLQGTVCGHHIAEIQHIGIEFSLLGLPVNVCWPLTVTLSFCQLQTAAKLKRKPLKQSIAKHSRLAKAMGPVRGLARKGTGRLDDWGSIPEPTWWKWRTNS